MRILTPEIANRTPENPNNVQFEAHYLGEYQTFFDRLYENERYAIIAPQIDGVDNEIVKRRVLDRALWLYGKSLTTINKISLHNEKKVPKSSMWRLSEAR